MRFPPPKRAHGLRPCASRVLARPRRQMRAFSVGVDRGWLGSQAFYKASAFNANIGAWNTASIITSLSGVCAALSGPGGAPPQAGRARWVVDAARAVVRGGTADVLARVRADVLARACAGVHGCRYSCAYKRRVICMYGYTCMNICIYIYSMHCT